MTRILQCLVWITVMTAQGQSQKEFSYGYQQHRTNIFPETNMHTDHPRNRQPGQSIQSELQDPRRQRVLNRMSELKRTENRIQLSKRDALDDDQNQSSQVVFPGPTSKSRFEPEISEECKQRGYCERIPNYPKDQAKQLIDKFGNSITGKFRMDELDTSTVQIAQRFGAEGISFNLCNSSERILVPDSLPDKNEKWWTILQDRGNNMTQGFRAETCYQRDGSCSALISVPPGYTSKCEQKFGFRTVITVEGNKIINERQLKVPSCCSCTISAPFK